MADSQVKLSLPPTWFFKFPPDAHPESLNPPLAFDEAHIRSPLNIAPEIYNKALNPVLPVVFAITYILVAATINRINRSRDYRPYWISGTRAFSIFVILHNVGLAIYSAVTCAAMLRAVSVSFPGFFGPDGFAGAADALCKLHGPRGYGDAIVFDPMSLKWVARNRQIHLAPNGLIPDSTDVGRIWNEGLAFWGWLFYLSKFYEVVDTLIILAKGKRSSTLQTYHHAGAMLCMWSGIRYMSPPIWMFVTVNAGIHAMMYTYYTFSALKFRVPGRIKRFITSLQILQFLVGASYASLHLFVSYKAPISVHQTLASILSSVPPAASEAAAAFAAIADDLFTSASIGSKAAEATAHPSSWLMKLLYRAGGAEGLAETVHNGAGHLFGHEYARSPNMPAVSPLEEIQYRTELQEVRCLDTSGEAFAIWLNVLYLAPLTVLFVRFFVKTYIYRTPKLQIEQKEVSRLASKAANETKGAAEAVGKAVEKKIGEALEGTKEAMRNTGTEGYRELTDKGLTSDEAMEDAVDEAADADRIANLRDLKYNGEGALLSDDAARNSPNEFDSRMEKDSIANSVKRKMNVDAARSRSKSLESQEFDDKRNQPPIHTEDDTTVTERSRSKANGYLDSSELPHDSSTSLEDSGVLVNLSSFEGQHAIGSGEEADVSERRANPSQVQEYSPLPRKNGHLSQGSYFGELKDSPSKNKSKGSAFDKVWFGSERMKPKKKLSKETSGPFPQDRSAVGGIASGTSGEGYVGNDMIPAPESGHETRNEETDASPKPFFEVLPNAVIQPDSQHKRLTEGANDPASYSNSIEQDESSFAPEARLASREAGVAESAELDIDETRETNLQDGATTKDAYESVSYFNVVEDNNASLPVNEMVNYIAGTKTAQHAVAHEGLSETSEAIRGKEENPETATEPISFSESIADSHPVSPGIGAEHTLRATIGAPSNDRVPVEVIPEPAIYAQAVKDAFSLYYKGLQGQGSAGPMAHLACSNEIQLPSPEHVKGTTVRQTAENIDNKESATPRNGMEDVYQAEDKSAPTDKPRPGQLADIITSEPAEDEVDGMAPDTASSIAQDDRSIDTLPSVSVDSDDIAPAAAEHIVAEKADEIHVSDGENSTHAVVDDDGAAIGADDEET